MLVQIVEVIWEGVDWMILLHVRLMVSDGGVSQFIYKFVRLNNHSIMRIRCAKVDSKLLYFKVKNVKNLVIYIYLFKE